MKIIKQTGCELLALAVIGLVVGLSANSLRAKGSLELGKDYFYIPPTEKLPEPDHTNGTDKVEPGTSNPKQPEGGGEPVSEKPKYPYQTIDYAGVVAVLKDPDTQTGLNVFVDARNDHAYEAGHIPGAVQCDPYNVPQYWDNVEPRVMGALKVVVYCGGGDCEDSAYMCRELVNQGVPMEAIYLYEGGWNEWDAKHGPVETGRPDAAEETP